jgi:putative transposase
MKILNLFGTLYCNMPHSYSKIWLHVVFSTKNREPLITLNVEDKIHEHLRTQLIDLGCIPRAINGMPDHIHLLFLLPPSKSVSDVLKQIKGSTSHWINENHMMVEQFAWQTGYGVFSVSESQVDRVVHYIANQTTSL